MNEYVEMYEGYEIKTRIEQDESPESPEDFLSCKVEVCYSQQGFDLAIERHGLTTGMVQDLHNGEVVTPKNGGWYRGVGKYEHGGVAYFLTRSLKHLRMPDQRWDVSPLVGFIWMGAQERRREGITRKAAFEKTAESCLETYSSWANGEVYGWLYEVRGPDGEVATQDSCWGYYGWQEHSYMEEEALSNARAAVGTLLQRAFHGC